MGSEKIHREITKIRSKEATRIWQFLLGLVILTFILLVLFVGFLGPDAAWIAYFLSVSVLAGWLAFHLLNLESRKQELEEKAKERKDI
ncbi:MAG: hypothetical protein NT067_06335 [Candidatus Diapherotrites archaeon]|nr:hypothetical protein [Candidatus Diapherotrites archaeon]